MPAAFLFKASSKLPEFVGIKAGTVAELEEGIRRADNASLFHHTFHFLYDHPFARRQPPSDFAYWVGTILLDHGLAERLAAITIGQCATLASLRERLLRILEEHRRSHECRTSSPDGMDFFFMRSNSVVVPTSRQATDLPSFAEAIESVGPSSIYHHLFESKLSRQDGRNDFSAWLEDEWNQSTAARRLEALDPFLMSLGDIRRGILGLLESERRTRAA